MAQAGTVGQAPALPSATANASFKQWLAVFGAVLGAFMAVLDISITNASLSNIEGSLNAGLEEGSWIATAYMVAEVVVIPLTAWLCDVFSTRLYLIVNSILFILFSVCCGMSTTLPQMIFFRFLQGLTGGVLIPVAAAIIIKILPIHQRPMGLALFSVVATFAPSLGPTIGGWLTVNFGWPYIFFLNLVPGIFVVGIISYAIPPAPLKLDLLKNGDWWGIATMAVGLSSIEIVLEEGNRKDWFGDPNICWLALMGAAALLIFIAIELKRKRPFINLRLVKQRNFGLSLFLSVALGMGLYGSTYILPLYLSQIQRYDALQIGCVIMWVGLPQLLIIPVVPKLMKFIDSRLLIAFGISFFALSCYINGFMTPDVAGDQLRVTQIIRAIGQPMIMTPLQTVAYAGILAQDVGSASAIFNMTRNLGGSIGIAVLSTILQTRYQFHFARLTESMPAVSPTIQQRLAQQTRLLTIKGLSPSQAHAQALGHLYASMTKQSFLMSFNDCFYLMAMTLVASLLALTLIRRTSLTLGRSGRSANLAAH